jgi:hypothetical protein
MNGLNMCNFGGTSRGELKYRFDHQSGLFFSPRSKQNFSSPLKTVTYTVTMTGNLQDVSTGRVLFLYFGTFRYEMIRNLLDDR